MFKNLVIFFTISLLIFHSTFASHNLAGQITYYRIGANTYEITLTTYTDPIAQGVDRCDAEIEIFGLQGSTYVKFDEIKKIPRINGARGSCDSQSKMGEFIRPRIKRNIYKTTFTFNGPGKFALRYYDVARVNDVKNMSNSGSTAFFVETILVNNPFIGNNNSPQLLNDPLDNACLNKLWTHNPGGFDPDNDSLVYSLINCQQYNPPGNINSPRPCGNFQFPSSFGGSFTIDSETGIVTWDKPQQIGVYNIAILIEEYRNGRKLGSVIRDMAIFVEPCNNNPPIITALKDTCIRPGDFISFVATVNDPDFVTKGDSVYFYLNNGGLLNNGPFSVSTSPATFNPPLSSFPIKGFPIKQGEFQWQTTCDHIRKNFYQIDFYAHDNLGFSPPLAANHITKIRIIPGPVTNLTATSGSRKITLNWDLHECSNAIFYEIYRASSSMTSSNDTVCCKNDLTGYQYVGKTNGNVNSYLDDNNGLGLEFQDQYCYRVIAIFPDMSKSCESNEVCINIKRDFPIVTNDSINVTGINGNLFVAWTKPTEIDTNFYRPPYTYKLLRANGLNGTAFQFINNFIFTDTTYFDNNLNTQDSIWTYKVDLYDSTMTLIGKGNRASSIFLNITPADRVLKLQWDQNVPWIVDSTIIFRSDTLNGPYDSVATVIGNANFYNDINLNNGNDYCYFVRTYSHYSSVGLKSPLINDSQKTCATPIDMTAPCLPGTDSISTIVICDDFKVEFSWFKPDSVCGGDIDFYTVYFTNSINGTYNPIHRTSSLNDTLFIFTASSITGCFKVTATDTSGNESVFSEPFCTENCSYIVLPNVFTPNGDGINDFFKPVEYRAVLNCNFQVFDRWGKQVGISNNINSLWDGNINGKQAIEGVYFYTIEATIDNLKQQKVRRTGSFTLLR